MLRVKLPALKDGACGARAGQGDSIEQTRDNHREALELFCETASPEEVEHRLHGEVFVTHVEVPVRIPVRELDVA